MPIGLVERSSNMYKCASLGGASGRPVPSRLGLGGLPPSQKPRRHQTLRFCCRFSLSGFLSVPMFPVRSPLAAEQSSALSRGGLRPPRNPRYRFARRGGPSGPPRTPPAGLSGGSAPQDPPENGPMFRCSVFLLRKPPSSAPFAKPKASIGHAHPEEFSLVGVQRLPPSACTTHVDPVARLLPCVSRRSARASWNRRSFPGGLGGRSPPRGPQGGVRGGPLGPPRPAKR